MQISIIACSPGMHFGAIFNLQKKMAITQKKIAISEKKLNLF